MLGFSPLAASALGDDGGIGVSALTANQVTTGSPVVDSPTLSQTHNLTANQITTAAPVIDSPIIPETFELIAEAIIINAPTIDQTRILGFPALFTIDVDYGTELLIAESSCKANLDIFTGSDIIIIDSETDVVIEAESKTDVVIDDPYLLAKVA